MGEELWKEDEAVNIPKYKAKHTRNNSENERRCQQCEKDESQSHWLIEKERVVGVAETAEDAQTHSH